MQDGGREDDHQRDSDHELRQRSEHQRAERGGHVECSVPSQRGVRADRDRERDRDQPCAQNQDRRVDYPVADELGYRLLRRQRVAGVAVEKAAGPGQVLRNHRLVEMKLLPQGGKARGCRRAAEDRSRRVTERLRGREDNDRHQHQDHDPEHEASQDEAPDRAYSSRGPETSRLGGPARDQRRLESVSRTRWS